MPKWLDNAVFYEIYPQSFMDSNGDGIGDFQGIISKLDYIKELGCNAIWMNPCFESPFNDAGYDIADYYKAAPRYGTNEDLKHLFEQVHQRQMHIILDLVPGHTSVEHNWFKESKKAKKNEFSNRYIWTDAIWEGLDNVTNVTGCIRGISDRNGSCAVNFFSSQPALNYGFAKPEKSWQLSVDSEDALATREAMKDIMKFWLDLGCDGFRVDMAGSLVKNDEGSVETIKLWQNFRHFLDNEYPEAAIISEWGEPDKSLLAGFHMDFVLHFGPSHYLDLFRCDYPYFSKEGKGDISKFITTYMENYRLTDGKGLICIPSGNHDMDRIARRLDNEELKLAFAFILSMPGSPFIYYGDEIGMRYLEGITSVEGGYERTGARTPMQWDNTKNAGFSSAPANELYIMQDSSVDRPTVETMMEDKDSLWYEIQKLISIRLREEALCSNGKLEILYAEKEKYPFIYKRTGENNSIVVVINPSLDTIECNIEEEFEELVYSYNKPSTLKDGKVTVYPCSATFIRVS